MYSVSEPRNFVDVTDLDIESEWNPHYEDSPLLAPEEPQLPSQGFLYECAHCLATHSPSLPCNELDYSFQLPDSAGYQYQVPQYVAETSHANAFIESNYRKWLVSVTPR